MGRSGYSEPCAGETGALTAESSPTQTWPVPAIPLRSPMMTAVVWGAVFLLS